MIIDILNGENCVWESLKSESEPIVMYGMGNGAEAILRVCDEYKIKVSDIFASDEFVRGHSFMGYKVMKFSEIIEKYSNPVIIIGFATQKEDVLERIYSISKNYTVYAPELPLFGDGIYDNSFFEDNKDYIEQTYSLMSDESSRKTFENLMLFKFTGKIEYLKKINVPRNEVFQNIIRLNSNEKYVDLGAYDGDTINEFISITGGQYDSITAFEPDRKNFKKLISNVSNYSNLTAYEYASWNKTEKLSFSGKAGRMSSLYSSGYEVEARALDDVIGKATYIKIDVEGAEYETLIGAKRILSQCSPSLAVSLYHRAKDFFMLPLLVHKLAPELKIYIRHHPYIPSWETNLYATK